MNRLMIGISGVRGVVGENLTPELLVRLGQAYGTYADSGTVVVGRDTRVSGDMVKHAVFSGLLAAGCKIVDVGVCPTPSAAMMIRELNAAGGIVISASHNPIEWNALKFFRDDGVYLTEAQGRHLLDIYYGGDLRSVTYNHLHAVETDLSALDRHLEKVMAIVDVQAMRRRRFKIAIDCVNGAGVKLSQLFFQRIGAIVTEIHCTMDGHFAHPPEPTKDHLQELCHLTRQNGCDIGFAQDADADRLALVSEEGEYIGEEYTLCLASAMALSHNPGAVVTNLSTTRMIDDVAKRYNSQVIRTPVGEVNVADEMLRSKAVIGGEGNGGVIYPPVHYGRDALTGMALILQYMVETNMKVSELAAEIPTYHLTKLKIACSKRQILPLLESLAQEKADHVDTRDGVKLDFPDGWVHVRASNTEPIVRVYAEAATEQRSREIAKHYLNIVETRLAPNFKD